MLIGGGMYLPGPKEAFSSVTKMNSRLDPRGAGAVPFAKVPFAMTTRMTSRTVVFNRPFALSGFERVEPAGSYLVETEEEQLDSISQSAWRRMATVIHITHAETTEYIKIDALELDKALVRDGAPEDNQMSAQNRLAEDRRRNDARPVRRKKF